MVVFLCLKSNMNIEESNYNNRLNWMKTRIGKKVYRNDTFCDCEICKGVTSHGLIISDETHANYLCDMEFVMELRYRDTPTL